MTYSSGSSAAQEFDSFYNDSYRVWGAYYAAAYRDVRAYAGDNWTVQERNYLYQQRRQILELNRIRRIVNLYSGYERENRKATVVGPVESSDEETADQLSMVMYHVYDKGGAHSSFSDGFEHMLKSGLAVLGIYLDYSKDKIHGDIKYYWKPFNAVIFDPYFTKRDLSDCDAVATRDLLSKDQVKMLVPWVSPKEIDEIPTGIRDNKYQYLGIYRQYNSTYIAKNLVTYDQYWKVIHKPVKLLVDMETGESREWNGKKEDNILLQRILEQQPEVKLMNSYKRSVQLNVIIGGVLVYEGPDPTGLDDYPFRPLLCSFEPLIDQFEMKVQGIVRSMIDAQRMYNKKWSQMMDYNESILNTGWVVRNGAVVDPNMLMQSGQGKVIVLNDKYTMADIQQIRPADVPASSFQYNDMLERNMVEIPGGSDELMGISSVGDTQISGKLAQVRASNGLKGNRGLFDSYEETLKQMGMLTLEAIQKNYSYGKIKRIINQEPTEQIKSQAFEQYDCVIKQAVMTQSQREAYYYELLRLRELGLAIPDDAILENAPLQGKNDLTKRMAKQAEQAEQFQQLEREDKHRQDMLEESKIQQNLALAEERRARVVADLGLAKERISEAEQNTSQASLNQVKTIAEIEQLDQNKLLEIARLMHDMQVHSDTREDMKMQRLESESKQVSQQATGGS